DGATWIQAQAAPWSARQAPRVAVLNNEMYLIGGNTGGDEVWLTTDGQNWTQQTSPAWDARQFHGIASPFDNKLWVFGGFDNTVVPTAVVGDIWSFNLGQPQITSTPPIVATAGVAYSYTVTATGNPTPTITATGLPAWLMFDNIDTLSGTPTSADIGLTPQITVTAGNAVAFDQQQFQIDVQGVAPAITSTPPTTAAATTLYTYTVATTGEPAPALSASALPAWLIFNPTTGELSGT